MKTFGNVLNFCRQTVQKCNGINQDLLTQRTEHGEFQVYNESINCQIGITPKSAEFHALKLEYNDTTKRFTVRTAIDETYNLLTKKEYELSENLTEIINDYFDSYLLIDAVFALLKLNLD